MVGEEKIVNHIRLVETLYKEKKDYNPKLVEQNVGFFNTEENLKRVLGDENLHEDVSCGRYALSENSLR